MATATSDRLLFRNTMAITPGHLAEFTRAIRDAVEFAEANAPQVLVDVFIDEERMEATSFQLYADSDAVLQHWKLSDPYIAGVMEHCRVAAFEVFGSPSTAVLDGLGATSGMQTTITARLIGYDRVGPG
jgi:hypothetical protein